MILHTLWGARKGESTPELMTAWDEYSVDSNSDGFREDCARAIKSWGNDLDTHRYLDIEISEDRLMQAFDSARIEGRLR